MDNKINTSIQNKYLETQLRKEIAKQDVYRAFVLNANSIAPQQNRAYLLKSRNPISSFIISVADTGKDVVELGKALVTGKSNDNQLGRFNDLGMKIGSLGIASYLFTKRGTGTKGIMEFLGAGAFFASMAAWPRLFISEPLKMRFGFDIRQQYIDAQGRKKRLYLDNQFVPDLYSQEEIDKIADKIGINKSNPEYRELTKEKMRTIALQGNTLWMLTAGFSPLLTSMICNLAERGVTKYIVNSQYNKILKQTDKLEELAQKRQLDEALNLVDFEKIKHLTSTLKKDPDDRFFTEVARLIDPFGIIMNAKDTDDANLISELTGLAPKIKGQLQQSFVAQNAKEGTQALIETDKAIDTVRKYLKSGYGDLQGNSSLGAHVRKIIDDLIATKDPNAAIDYITVEDFSKIFKEATKEVVKPEEIEKLKNAYKNCINLQSANPEAIEKLCRDIEQIYSGQTRPISAKVATYADFLNGLVGQKYESLHTSIHLNSVNALMQALDIPDKELETARGSLDAAKDILQGHLRDIASDDANYKAFISDLTSRQAKYEADTVDKLIVSIKDKISRGIKEAFSTIPDDSPLAILKSQTLIDTNGLKKLVEDTFKVSYDQFIQEAGKDLTPEQVVALLDKKGVDTNSLIREPLFKRVIDLFVEEKGAGIRATGHRYLLEADFERRLHTGELKDYWKYLSGQEEISDEVLKLCRSIIYDGTMNDLSNKFYADGNGDLAPKIIKLIFGDPSATGEDAMRAGLSKLTYESCDKSMTQKLVASRENFYKIYAQMVDFARPGHKIADIGTDALQKTQYSMLGKPGTELFMDTASKMFNDKHWMRIFLPMTLVVIGITLLSQMFFGKVKNEHLYKQKKDDGGVNAGK